MDMVSCTCRTAAWVLSHIASVAYPRSGRSTPASCETSIQQILVQSLVFQLEFLEVVLLGLLSSLILDAPIPEEFCIFAAGGAYPIG
jgi:hypothetical protein